MSLFEILDPPNGKSDYSNTIEIYDALPKYNWATRREYGIQDLEETDLVRHTTVRNREYKVVVRPAILKRNGKSVFIYPGPREEVVEDVLRKFAVAGQGKYVNDNVGVTFTLTQLQNELAATGHSYDINEIKEAIEVCRGATLECYTDNDETVINSGFFAAVGLTTRGDWLKRGPDARCFVQFNPMVTNSIMALTFRQYNYRLGMEIGSPLARFIYKRMSHYWTQAHTMAPYTPSLVSFLSQSPRGLSPRMPENIRAMKNALDVLIKRKIVSDYDAEQIKKPGSRKVIDVRYAIRPHENFVKMAMSANKRRQDMMQTIEMDAPQSLPSRSRRTKKS